MGERRRRRPGGWRPWIAAGVVLAATAYLMATGFRGASTYYLGVDEALARVERAADPIPVRIRGTVLPGTLQVDSVNLEVVFRMGPESPVASAAVEASSGRHLTVTYHGAAPDNLMEGRQVIVEGALRPGGDLEAAQVLVTCPSRYEAGESGDRAGS